MSNVHLQTKNADNRLPSGIASIQAATGTSIWLILLYPLLFTAGMCLIDTTDGALMFVLYTSSSASRDTITILYYSILLTAITVVVAIVIGTIQVLSLVQNVTGYEDGFWKGVGVVGDHFEVLGGAICGCFVVVGLGGWWAQPRWRAWVVGRYEREGVEANGDRGRVEAVGGREGVVSDGPGGDGDVKDRGDVKSAGKTTQQEVGVVEVVGESSESAAR